MSVFKAVNWSPNEQVGEVKMDTMAANADYLMTNTPRAVYTIPGIARGEGVRMVSGRAAFTPVNNNSEVVTVTFGNFFSNGCQPNITTAVVSNSAKMIFNVIFGIGTLIPDHTGFQIQIVLDGPGTKIYTIQKTMYVTWSAMGY